MAHLTQGSTICTAIDLDAISEDADDIPVHVPAAPTTKRRARHTLDQDGVEELDQAEHVAASGRAAVVKGHRNQRGDRTSTGSGFRRERLPTARQVLRTPSARPVSTAYIDLLSDDEDSPPVQPQTQQHENASILPKASTPLSDTISNTCLPQRPKDVEPSDTGMDAIPIKAATSPISAPSRFLSLPRLSNRETAESFAKMPSAMQSNASIAKPEALPISTTPKSAPGGDASPIYPEDIKVPANHEGVQVATDDPIAARSAIDTCLRRQLQTRHDQHAYLVCAKMRRQRTCQEQELRAHGHKGKSPIPSLPGKYMQKASPFESMSPIQVPFDKKTSYRRFPHLNQEVFIKAKPKDIIVKSKMAASRMTGYKTDAVQIPPFREYVSLKNSILADNESKLLATPYFEDEEFEGRQTLLATLPYVYELTHDEFGPLGFRKEQRSFYKDSIEAFLAEIDVSWNDVLYWLLAPEKMIRRINDTLRASELFEGTLLERVRYEVEIFERDGDMKRATLFERKSKKWRKFLPQLNEPTARALRLVAIACAAVFQECKFNIWYLAQQSTAVQKHVLEKTAEGRSDTQSTYRQFMCRVCHQHNCVRHGEIREIPEDSWNTDPDEDATPEDEETDHQEGHSKNRHAQRDSHLHAQDDHTDVEDHEEEGPLPAHFHDDSDLEKVINYKLYANPDTFNVCPESEMIRSKGTKPPAGRFNSSWWLQQDLTHHWEKRKPFFPCNHHGACEYAQCRCFREGITCEKTCKCSMLCNRRYPGCSCTAAQAKRVCGTASCLCVKFNRECDADLCGSCGATDILDPVNRYNEDIVESNCCNVAIQKGVPRKTLLGQSEVHGFGLYMGEDIKGGEFIGEYTGEAISVDEGDRRSTIYDYQKTMYLFRLNLKQEVDATYMGNKLRFINNADDKYTNCCPKNLFCDTVFRIALFATVDIKAGTELFFNYNYPKEKTAQFKQPNGKVVAVKQQTKHKAKRNESLTSTQPIADRSKVLAATAKARAAKALKRAAMQEAEAAQGSSSTRRLSGPLQIRKTATSKPGRKIARKSTKPIARKSVARKDRVTDPVASDSDMDRKAKEDPEDIPRSTEAQNTKSTQSTLFVPDSEEDDDEFVLDNAQDDEGREVSTSDSEDTAAEDLSETTSRGSKSSRLRRKASGGASLVVVKRITKKTSGARPAADRMRKGRIVVSSDEE
ncbi:hypothetical protein BDW02DRAFT_336506 [Decorospora gaudefroyi]|uniref:SET domain-containing protein n=1 Tax=Decorospora gaudefroyi TaxID=184978 RepID=A0A6A5KRH0_9PLEO|nr:hypothetical protein BDW02DRAFT_336506 [Decorospora gaudefroyi]